MEISCHALGHGAWTQDYLEQNVAASGRDSACSVQGASSAFPCVCAFLAGNLPILALTELNW